MLYALLDNGAALSALLERAGIPSNTLLESLATSFQGRQHEKLQSGKRPVAAKSLRIVIEKSFEKMEARDAENASAVDFLLATLDSAEEDLKSDLRKLGVTSKIIGEAAAARRS